jgi:GTP 3',8-cyclase
VARRWTYADGRGEIGVISSVTDPFCGGCTRARVTATGELFTCLFAEHGRDLRDALRSGGSDDDIASLIDGVWASRDDRYSELRSENVTGTARPEMSYLGG